MTTLLRTLLAPTARKIRRRVRQSILFPSLLRRFAADPAAGARDRILLDALVSAWGNESYSAHSEYLQVIVETVLRARGNVLECGSGLSTVLLAAAGRSAGTCVLTLEHSVTWAQEVNASLRRFGLSQYASVLSTPLKHHGGYVWYDQSCLPPGTRFSVVVCDGPPGDTQGGRYGLLPAMRGRMEPGAIVLLDDSAREGEQLVLKRWADETAGTYTQLFGSKPFAVFTLPQRAT